MFRLPVLVLLSLAIAFGGGAWSASWALKATSGSGTITLGVWNAYPDLQTASADPFAKAHRASDGRLLLGRAEGLVFTALSDQSGASLSAGCTYEIAGTTPPARFWSLMITDSQGSPLAAPPRVPGGLNSWTTLRRADGGFSIQAGPRAVPGNWIWLDGAEPVAFVLTLFDTPTAGSAGLIALDMPTVTLIGCRDA